MKIIILCGEGYNQVALANKINERLGVAGIIVEKTPSKNVSSFSITQLVEKLLNRTVFGVLHQTWAKLFGYYKKCYPKFPEVKKIVVDKINSDESVNFIESIKPDLLVVSGTSLLKKKIIQLSPSKGIVNLHTGLSPYIKGAPNCTNWCIVEEKFHLIGNTIMWIDEGIDSGDIITTEMTPLSGKETFLQLHVKVMEHAHDLYINAIQKIKDDFENCPRVKQLSIAPGTTYYNKQWNWKAKFRLLKNLRKYKEYFLSEKYKTDKKDVITVSLQQGNEK